MNKIKDGGPAFPCSYYAPCTCGLQLQVTGHGGGMTLRQWYAGMALQGLLSNLGTHGVISDAKGFISKECFLIADAMLAESEKN